MLAEEFIAWEWTARAIQLKERDQLSAIKQATVLASASVAPSPSKRLAAAAAAAAAAAEQLKSEPKATFTFDYMFHPHATNDDVYRVIGKHVVVGAVAGFHSSIFAYGQTSTGKTHTMLGAESKISGILGHAVHDVFEMIRASPDRE
jgi:hypothetical protein